MHTLDARKTVLILLALGLTLALAACGLNLERPGETVTQTEAVELEGAESVRVHLQGGLGDLALEGGAPDLFNGEFRYNMEQLVVAVDYSVSGDEGILTIQPESDRVTSIPTGDVVSEWDMQFAENVPLEMDVNLGLGDSDLDFSALTLSDLEISSGAGDVTVNVGRQTLERFDFNAGLGRVELVLPGGSVQRLDFEAGAGDVEIDLSGNWETDLDASIERGLGNLTLTLPEDVGVRVAVESGLGEVEADGFTIDGDAYVNEAYDGPGAQLAIDVGGGLGNVRLILR
jgi:hypothetical protein